MADMLPAAPTRQVNTENNREEKIWNRVKVILQNMKVGIEMNEDNLRKLKEKLNPEMRKRRGRKLGQTKMISTLSKQYLGFFRCVYAQFGGRQKVSYNEDAVQSSGQVVCNMLNYFQAHLNIPKDDSVLEADHLLQEGDRLILRYIRDRKEHISESEKSEKDKTSRHILPTSDITPAEVQNGLTSSAAISAQVANISMALPKVPLFDLFNITPRIPYLCPPNHTTLVGFRTFLLSRRNIALNADDADRKSKSYVTDTENSDGSSTSRSEHIIPEAAAALWKERLTSLFLWPAIMSNTVPKVMNHLFQSDGHPVASTSEVIGENEIENGDAGVTKLKTNRKLCKKRKNRHKVERHVAVSPPQKKRKYEKSGKYKKPARECVLLRRSSRHASVLQVDS
jgi:hypothetical protein